MSPVHLSGSVYVEDMGRQLALSVRMRKLEEPKQTIFLDRATLVKLDAYRKAWDAAQSSQESGSITNLIHDLTARIERLERASVVREPS